MINVTSNEREMFLTLVSIRLTSTGLHMRYQNLRENTRDFFSGVELQDWNGIGYQSGYDTAEFTSYISGTLSRCIAVQRYLNPAFGGFKRHVDRHGLRGRQPGRGLRRAGKAAGAGGLGLGPAHHSHVTPAFESGSIARPHGPRPRRNCAKTPRIQRWMSGPGSRPG